jgi:hypothetical protein
MSEKLSDACAARGLHTNYPLFHLVWPEPVICISDGDRSFADWRQ